MRTSVVSGAALRLLTFAPKPKAPRLSEGARKLMKLEQLNGKLGRVIESLIDDMLDELEDTRGGA